MPDKDKRYWPLAMLKARREMLQLIGNDIVESNVTESYFSFKPVDEQLPYFFIVRNFDTYAATARYRVVYMPKTDSDAGEGEGNMSDVQLMSYFNDWVTLVRAYTEQLAFDHDSIVQGYEEEFLEGYILDEDANTHSYSTDIQLKIDTLCGNTIKLLNSYVNNNPLSENKKQEIESIIESVQELQDTQTQLVKQQVAKKLANVWARIKKAGIKLYKDVKAESFRALIKEGIKILLEDPMAPINFLKDQLE